MKFTECFFRIFTLINFFASFAQSNVVQITLAMVRQPHPSTPTFACSPGGIPTDQSSSGNLLLLDHCPVKSRPSRGPRRNLALVHSRSSLSNIRDRSTFRLISHGQGSAGCVCKRVGRPPHGHLGVSEGGVYRLPKRFTETCPVLSLSLGVKEYRGMTLAIM